MFWLIGCLYLEGGRRHGIMLIQLFHMDPSKYQIRYDQTLKIRYMLKISNVCIPLSATIHCYCITVG